MMLVEAMDEQGRRLGDYQICKEIAQNPGVTLVEAIHPETGLCWLQLIELSSTPSISERAAMVAARVTERFRESFDIWDHRTIIHPDGGTTLFWVMPPRDGWAPASQREWTVEQVADVAASLDQWLSAEHEQQRRHPTLSDGTIHVDDHGQVTVFGVPLAFGSHWYGPEMIPPPWAPEEEPAGPPTEAGDLWRIGRLLQALLARTPNSDAQSRTHRCIEVAIAELGTLDVSDRVTRGRAALRRVAMSDPASSSMETVEFDEAELDSLSRRPAAAEAVDAPTVDANGLDASARGSVQPKSSAIEEAIRDALDTSGRHPSDPMTRLEERGVSSSARRLDALLRSASGHQDEAPEGAGVAAFNPRRRKGLPAPVPSPPTQPIVPPVSPTSTPRLLQRPVIEIHSAQSEAMPVGAPQEEPSLTVEPQPLVEPSDLSDPSGQTTAASDLRSRSAILTAAAGGQVPRAGQRRSGAWSRTALALIFVIAGAGIGFSVSKAVRSPAAALPKSTVLISDSDVLLRSDPRGADVFAEADGRLLGQTPLRLLAPADSELVVILHARGHRPARLPLPEAGAMMIELSREPADECEVVVTGDPSARLTEHGGLQTIPGTVRVRGAAVFLQSVIGRPVGARVIRCPSEPDSAPVEVALRPPKRRRIRVTGPASAQVSLDGQPLGVLPAEAVTERAFIELRVEHGAGPKETWWVGAPAMADVHIVEPSERNRGAAPTSLAVAKEADPPDARRRYTPPQVKLTEEQREEVAKWFRRARAALAAGQIKRARSRFRRCVGADPSHAECHLGLADTYDQLEFSECAVGHYRRYLALRPNGGEVRRVQRELDEAPCELLGACAPRGDDGL